MKIISLFLLLGCEDVDSTVEEDVTTVMSNDDQNKKINQADLVHGQILEGRRNIAKEKLQKGELESAEENGLYVFYYCSLEPESELCFGDFKEAKGSKDIPLYNTILQLREKKWSKAKIYADGIEDEQLRVGLGLLALLEKALQDDSKALNVDQNISFHQTILQALQSTDPSVPLEGLNDAPWYYKLAGAKIALIRGQNSTAKKLTTSLLTDKNPLAQVEGLRVRSQIMDPNLAVDNLQKASEIFEKHADVSSLVFIAENIAIQSRGLGESNQIRDWFDKNYNNKQFEEEKAVSSKLLLRTAIMDLIGFHHQGSNSYNKIVELSKKNDNSLILSQFTFVQLYHAVNAGNLTLVKNLAEQSQGEYKTLLEVVSKLLASEVVGGAETSLEFLPTRQFLLLGIDICKMNSDIGKRLLPKLIMTAQTEQLPIFELEASLLLESIYRYEGSSQGLTLLQQLEKKYPSSALSAEIAVRTFLLTPKALPNTNNSSIEFWRAMIDPLSHTAFPTIKIPNNLSKMDNSLEQKQEEKKQEEKKQEEKKQEEKKQEEKKQEEKKQEENLNETVGKNKPSEGTENNQEAQADSKGNTTLASKETEVALIDGIPVLFDQVHNLFQLKFALKTKRPPSNQLNQFWQRSTFHRQGMLSLGTVLDGSQGMSIDNYIAEHVDNTDSLTVSSLLILQEADRRRKQLMEEGFSGRNFLYGMDDTEKLPLIEATHRGSIELLSHYLGQEFPYQALQNLKNVEEKLYKNIKNSEVKSIWEKLTTNGNVDVTALRDIFGKTAILSYSFHKGRVLGISLSPKNAAIRDLGTQKSIVGLANKHIAQLEAGKNDPNIYLPRSSNHKLANTLRQILIEPFKGELYGFGRYLIIAPNEFLYFSFTTFPDQQDGMRFLGEKRTITSTTGLAEILENSSQFGSYEPDMLAMSRLGKIEDQLAAGLQPSESVPIQIVSIHFRPDSRTILQNEEVTLEKFRSIAHGARYLYLSDIPTSPDGGFEFKDGTLTLSEIHQSHLASQVVFISASNSIETQIKRARAFLDAGVRSVMINTHAIDKQSERIMLDALFESLNRDDTLAQALSNARSSYIKESSKQGAEVSFVSNPGVWGTFHLFGQP